MARWQGTTTERGLGSPHQRIGRQLFAVWKPGDPCARCGQPMWHRWTVTADGRRVSAIDVDDFPGRIYGGPQVKRLSHRSCNRRAGQAITAAINRARGGLTPRQQAAIRAKQAAANMKAASGGNRMRGPAPWVTSRQW
jgi:hypothetical protein